MMAAATMSPAVEAPPHWRSAVASGVAGKLGVVLLLIGVSVALLGPYGATYGPTSLAGLPLDPPSAKHWLGTDQLGRDVLSRVLHGGRSVLILAALAVAVTFTISGPLGLLAGYRGGTLDAVMSRIADVMMSVPPLILVLIFVFVVGSSNLSIVLLTGVVTAPRVFRIVRGATQSVAEQDYVLAARARGERMVDIIGRELLPNVTGPLLTEAAIRLNFSIMFIATLNFLGLGVQPPSSDWGLMVSEGRVYLGQSPLISVAPALAIAVLTIGINLVSDQIGAHLARNTSGHADL
jgi:peptide/nickel transport system permease protein